MPIEFGERLNPSWDALRARTLTGGAFSEGSLTSNISGLPAASTIGQVLFSIDGATFTAQLPVTDEAGWLVDETTGILIVA